MIYHLSDFDYDLPSSQIAQHPLPDRSASRLLVLDRASGEIRHLHFRDLPGLIPSRDVLVINTSRV
ncbi:MAG TPA: S-adenosylmethionine:tRNA ribosyltransferase-isomerase, partial [Gemmatimonadales bacterium]|nr:S-adenosylmethionine:tRNA ribosyltransferase-isomerase [Gemmatimonadales bacterium]